MYELLCQDAAQEPGEVGRVVLAPGPLIRRRVAPDARAHNAGREQDGRGRCGVERVDRTRKACCGAEEVAMAGRVAHRAEAAHREARHRPVPPVTERPEVTLDVLLQDARVECLPLP